MAQRSQSLSEPFIYPPDWAPDSLHHSFQEQRRDSLREQLRELGFAEESVEHVLGTHNVGDLNDALQLLGRDELMCSICSRSTSEPVVRPVEICGICYEGRESLFELSCSHRFCTDCLHNYAEAAVTSGKVLRVKCPQADCDKDLQELEGLLSREMVEKFKRFRKNQLVSLEPNARWCPTPDCENVLRDGSLDRPKMTCPKCKSEVCFKCGEYFHPRKTCGQAADQAYEMWAKGKDIQHCPVCRRRIEKEDGCNHMQCPACSYQWCWLCRGRYTDMHYSSLNPFGCPGLQSAEHTLTRWPWYKRWVLRLCVLLLFPLVLIFGVPVMFTYKTMELMDEWCYTRTSLCACLKYCFLLPLVFTIGVLCTPLVLVLSCPPLVCFLLVNCFTGVKFKLRIWAARLRTDGGTRGVLV